jgi:small subunit ribosomal protein S21
LGKDDLEVIMGKKTPVHVEVKARHRDESVEKLIKRFMKKVKNERIIEKTLERRRFIKPSVKRRKEKMRRKKLMQKLLQKQKQLLDDK